MTERKGAVVVGASSGLGRAIAEEFAKRGTPVVVASPDPVDNEALSAHFAAVHGTFAAPVTFDLSAGREGALKLVRECRALLGDIDTFILTAAIISDHDEGLIPGPAAESIVNIDLLGPIHLLTEFSRLFEERGSGTLVTFSSIAAPVPRKKNLTYAAAKSGLEVFCRGLRHYLCRTGVRVQVYRLGYVDTTMAAGRTKIFPKADPRRVALHVISRLNRDFGIAYYPRYWQLVVTAMRCLPWKVFSRLEF